MASSAERSDPAGETPLSALDRAIRERRFIVTAELTSPTGPGVASIRRRAEFLRGWITAANVPDGQAISAHLSPLAAARLLLDADIEPVLTLQCRDRNRLALQSDLIGAAALGVHNVLCLTGDRSEPGGVAVAKEVFDLDSVGLLQAGRGLGEGRLLDGTTFRPPARFVLGGAAHPFAPAWPAKIGRLIDKANAGARFVQTQYVFDLDAFRAWMDEVRAEGLDERLAILASVGPVRSPRVLGFLVQLEGVRIPPDVEQRFTGLDGAEFAEESLRLCAELARGLSEIPGLAGVHIMAPYWEEKIPEIIAQSGLNNGGNRA